MTWARESERASEPARGRERERDREGDTYVNQNERVRIVAREGDISTRAYRGGGGGGGREDSGARCFLTGERA